MIKRVRRARSRAVPLTTVALLLAGTPVIGHAIELTDPGSDVAVSWTNTIRYGAAFRTKGHSDALTRNANADDGDRNFDRGLVSNRLEVLSELDLQTKVGFGARVSGQAWYDTVYNRHNDNPGFAGGAVPNQTSVGQDQFTHTTRRMQGRDVQLRDAFVSYRNSIGDMPFSVRVGQHALVWGESLFFAANGIAGAQNRFDIARLKRDPTAQAKEFVLPVPQVSGQLQISEDVSIGAYYQARWKPNTFPAVGSYFSVNDLFGPGAENMWIGPGMAVAKGHDMEARNSGQGGVQIKWHAWDTDFGLYWLKFHDKTPQIITQLGLAGFGPGGPIVKPSGFYRAYHEDTKLVGFSANRTFGDANIAIEASYRRNQALASSGGTVDATGLMQALLPPGAVSPLNNSSNPAYAVGNTAHVNVSAIWALPPNALFRESTLVGEVAWNRMLSCTKNCSSLNPGVPAALDPNGSRDAWGLRMVFTPTFRQALPGLDVSVPISFSWSPKGSRSLALGPGVLPPAGGGDVSVGLSMVYDAAWYVDLAYTHYYGRADTLMSSDPSKAGAPPFTYGQDLKDRNFVSLTLRRSF